MASYECRGKKKLWSVRFVTFENGNEITKRLSGFKRKKDAEEAYIKFVTENQQATKIVADNNILNRKFEDVYKEYFKYKITKLRESTCYDINVIFEKHILPYFANLKIKEITKQVILKWQQQLEGFSYKYKTKIRSYLFSFYKYLFYYYDVDNVVSRVEPFKKDVNKQEMLIWSVDEFNKFINAIDNELLFKTFYTFLFYTGCRRGEALAISYADIDFIANTITISKSVSAKVLRGSSDATHKVTPPKNKGSIRTILMNDILSTSLKDYVKQFPQSKTSNFLFGLDKPLDEHIIQRRLDKYIEIAQVKKIRIHDFRHSHASFLIYLGANILLISKRLGHSNTQQTLNTYSHLYPNTEQELIDKMNEFGQKMVNQN